MIEEKSAKVLNSSAGGGDGGYDLSIESISNIADGHNPPTFLENQCCNEQHFLV